MTKLRANGRALLYTRRTIQGKVRGGLFPCIPQFGPDDRETGSAQAQHGFARDVTWKPGKNRKAGTFLTYACKEGEYAGLDSQVTYRINRSPKNFLSLFAELELHNDSDKNMRIAPAFHPYFNVADLPKDQIMGIQEDLAVAETVPASSASMQVARGMEVHVKTRGFERLTWWTDALGKYVCIEPSLAGPSFSTRPHEPSEAEILRPGDIRSFAMDITWQPTDTTQMVRNQPTLHGDRRR